MMVRGSSPNPVTSARSLHADWAPLGAEALLNAALLPIGALIAALLLTAVLAASVAAQSAQPSRVTQTVLAGPAAQAAPTVPAQPQDPLIAEVGGQALHLSDVYASIESLPLGDQIDARDELGTYIEAIINEEVLFQYALLRDFDGDDGLRAQVRELVVNHLIKHHVRSRLHISDEQVRAYYDANPALIRGEHVRVRQILLPVRSQCVALSRQVDTDETFAALAQARSLDPATAAVGGDAGLMMRAQGAVQGRELEYFDMQPGEMRIYDLPQGCLLVRQVYHVNPPLPPFDAVKENIRRYLSNVEEVRLLESLFSKAQLYVPVTRHSLPKAP